MIKIYIRCDRAETSFVMNKTYFNTAQVALVLNMFITQLDLMLCVFGKVVNYLVIIKLIINNQTISL